MTTILAVSNWKGGIGKTTTAVNIAAGLVIRDKKVLIIDSDPRSDIKVHLLPEDVKLINTTKSLYQGIPVENTIYPSVIPGLDVIPASVLLATVEFNLTSGVPTNTLLRDALDSPSISCYDYVIIDTPPSLGLLVYNVLMAVDKLIIPVNGYLAMESLEEYKSIIVSFQKENTKLKIDSIVMTIVESNTLVSKEIREIVEAAFGDKVCKTDIPKSVKFIEAPSHKKSIYDYAPGSKAAIQHMKLVDELLKKWER